MFYNNYSQNNSYDYNDCISHGACSISPSISSLQEVMFILLRQTVFYILKLEKAGVYNSALKSGVVTEIIALDSAGEYSEEQILSILSKQYTNLMQIRKLYIDTCLKMNVHCVDLKSLVKLSPDMSLSSIMNKGEKAFLNKYKQMNLRQKHLYEIMLGIIKSISHSLLQLEEYDKSSEKAYDEILSAIELFNHSRISAEKIQIKIKALVNTDLELLELISTTQINTYGDITETQVSYSTRPHKAILVSGSSFADLYSLLVSIKEKDIDVYTNGNLLVAHSFSAFKEFPQLKGHFGNGIENSILDFATFPGSILLTKNETKNIEYLYRGRLFTTDKIPPKGVAMIKNNDFTPIINSALKAKGFSKGQQRGVISVGFNQETLEASLENIATKFNNKVYKHLFIVGLSIYSAAQNDYFKKFFSLVPKNSFIITFSDFKKCNNILSINVGNDTALVANVMQRLFKKIPVNSERISFFLTRCDVSSLAGMISLKERGAHNIYLSDCPPTVINPSVLKSFTDIYNIKRTTTAKSDLISILEREQSDNN